ncbi:zinc-dependent peptidase [Zobellia alginiliquefaciens]|uniref:zinc-dependent peptidase n=1 Tax=Zobellia alginiliquefaciens TaxID=3032586 RepID=UPI0023E3E2AD|nr:zinc-dependent peptidase [Zobellia alginiliquefaciens]
MALAFLLFQVLYMVYYTIGLYALNPFVRTKLLSAKDRRLLEDNFAIYSELPISLREKCDKRIMWFRSRKKFVFYGRVDEKEELKLLLSASAILMTLGLKDYKMRRSLLRIIVYPSKYYSRINRRHHLGEYNPRFKTVIVSADTIWEGFRISDDNLNLALHEFAHALSFEMIRKSSWEARKFRVGLKKIKEIFLREGYAQKLADSNYFREYGMTNLQEFFSVAVENYAETPQKFLADFPELYAIIQKMLNFDFQVIPEQLPGEIATIES